MARRNPYQPSAWNRRSSWRAFVWAERGRFIRFAVVGGSNTAITLFVFAIAIKLGAWYPVAAVIGYVAGILNGYTWNRVWTFQSGPFHGPEFFRYAAVQVGGLAANVSGLVFAVEIVGMAKIAGEIVTLGSVVLVIYALNRWWIFAPRTMGVPR